MKRLKWAFYLLAGALIYSCSSDELIARSESSSSLLRKTLTEQELKNSAPMVFAAIDGLQQKNRSAFARGETATDSMFVIRMDRILQIEMKGWTCYTFSIERYPESRFTENLVVSVDPENKMYGRILNYDFTPQDIENVKNGIKLDLKDKVTMTEVKDIASTEKSSSDCIQISVEAGPLCPSGQHDVDAMNNGECDYVNEGSYVAGPQYVTHIVIDLDCFGSTHDVGGPSEGLGNYGGPSWGWSGGGGGFGSGGSGATNVNNGGSGIAGNMGEDGQNIPLILNPIKDINQDVPLLTSPLLLMPNIGPIDPCQQLKDIELPLKFEKIRLQGQLSNSQEQGSIMQSTLMPDESYKYSVQPATTGVSDRVQLDIGQKIVGHLHTHPPQGFPIPSVGDVIDLKYLFDSATSGRKNQIFSYTICRKYGEKITYALFVDDIDSLNVAIGTMLNAPNLAKFSTEEKKIDILLKLQADIFTKSDGDYEKSFLKQFATFGISMYKQTDPSSAWAKLTLDSIDPQDAPIVKTPCP